MATEDSTVVRRIWDGKIPVCFTLAQEDLSSQDRVPSPVYLMIPRLSYFPLVMERVVRHFIDYTDLTSQSSLTPATRVNQDVPEVGIEADSQSAVSDPPHDRKPSGDSPSIPPEHQVWLEFANQPLKWHYPVGLLFDLFANSLDIPWKLTLHFTSYPTDVLLAPPVHRQAVESHFMSLVKEADALKHRSQVMNQMQARDHQQLWTGLLNHHFDKFWTINRRLMEPLATNTALDSLRLPTRSSTASLPTSEDADSPSRTPPTESFVKEAASTASNPATPNRSQTPVSPIKAFRLIPLRLYRGSGDEHENNFPSGYIQKRIKPFTKDGSMTSVAEVMRNLLSAQSDKDEDSVLTGYNFILHGITLPLEAPIQWVSEYMSYADSFLHIVVRPCT